MPQRQPTRIRLCLPDESFTSIRPLRRDHVWRCDFAMVRTADGSAVRILVIIDEFTRECLKLVVARSLGSRELLEALWGLFVARGIPEYIRPDNGPEFAATAVRQWLARVGVKTLLLEPEGPWEDAYDKAFIGKMRDELLNREVFETFQEARVLMGLGPYDELRPQGSLTYTSPAPEAGVLEAGSAPTRELVQSVGAGSPAPGSHHPPSRGDSGHEAPPANREEAEGHVPSAHVQSAYEGAVLEIEEQEIELLGAPVREDGGHVAPRADGEQAGEDATPAHRQTTPEGAAAEIGEQGSGLPEAPVRGESARDVPLAEGEGARRRTPVGHYRPPREAEAGTRDEQTSDFLEVRQGTSEEIEVLRRGAEKGLSGFQLELGERYARGIKGAPRDVAEARNWLMRALHDPEFPEHKDQAAALLDELKSVMGAGSGKAASRLRGTARARLSSLNTWCAIAAIAAVAIAVLLWLGR